MASLICRWCDTRWPDDERYRDCPVCRERTEHSFHVTTVPPDEAEATAAGAKFGWWLWDTGRL